MVRRDWREYDVAVVMHALFAVILTASVAAMFPQDSAASQPSAPSPATQPAAISGTRSLIERLTDPDPRRREQAAAQIVAMGASARPDVVAAWRSGDPRIAPRAGTLLLQLPWSTRDDPPAVQQVLSGYGQREEEQRREITVKLGELPGGGPALIRLLREDPSDAIAWTAYAVIARLGNDNIDAKLREIDLGGVGVDERVAMKTAVARAWLGTDWPKGISLLAKVVETQEIAHSQDFGLMNFAFDLLAGDAVEHGRYDDAAQWRRRQAMRSSGSDASNGASRAILELFALHADFGPLAGIDGDLETFEDDLGRPEVLYALARMSDRSGQSLVAMALRHTIVRSVGLRQVAMDGNPLFQEQSFVGAWLAERGWSDDARRELLAMRNVGHVLAPQLKRINDASICAQLAQVAAENDDDATAAELYQQAQDYVDRGQDSAGIDSTISRHRMLAARSANDPAAAKKALDALLAQSADIELDAAINAIAYLRELGRKDEASALFAQAYEKQKSRPAQNRAMQLNNLAWLCARCGERLPEVVELSARATHQEPENAGYWDTAAEANFAAGNAPEAVKLESRALGLKPNDRFMTRQLARFKQQQGASK